VIRINLMAPGTQVASRGWCRHLVVPPEQRAALCGLAMLVATVAGVGTWWWSIDRERRAVEAQLAAAQADIARLQGVARLAEQATAGQRALEARLALVVRLRAAQQAPVALLESIGRSLTDGLWLTELEQTGATVQLDGRAMVFASLTDFIDRLQASGAFTRAINILETSTETASGVSVVRFVIRGEVSALAPLETAEPGVPGSRGGS